MKPEDLSGYSSHSAEGHYQQYTTDDLNGLPYPTAGNSIDPNLAGDQQHVNDVDVAPMLQQLQDASASAVVAVQASEAATHAATQAALAAAQQARQKQTRVAQACDACSQRKVKCDTASPCKNCTDLGVECTRNRARRRRGPPNRVKERMEVDKRTRTESDFDVSSAISSLNGASHSFGLSPTSTDLIAPADIISQLLASFYTFVFPLHPFPHEPSTTQAFTRRADIGHGNHNPLLALIAAMVGVVATLRPVQTEALVRNLGYGDITQFVHRARSVSVNARGIGYQDQADQDANDAVTSYFLALMSARAGQWAQYRRCISDAVAIVHNLSLMDSAQKKADEIKRQTGFRVFWSTFTLSRSIEHLNAIDALPQPRYPFEPYTHYPTPVPDDAVVQDGFQDTPPAIIPSPTLGLNATVHIFTAGETPFPSSADSDIVDTRNIPNLKPALLEAPAAVRNVLQSLEPSIQELIFGPKQSDPRLEIIRINLMLSSLVLRAYLIARALQAADAASTIPQEIEALSAERIAVEKGLLFLAKDISMVGMEPDIAAFALAVKKLLANLRRDERMPASDYAGHLYKFERCLEGFLTMNDESGEFAAKAGLKEWQMELITLGIAAEMRQFE